eukprot:m.68069 g.68069  ORF g.68069 m.68069 type:complete len:412 (+) comp14094_c0_seq1:36-1271(+)
MLRLVALLALGCAVAVSSAFPTSRLQVLSHPDYFQFNHEAGSIAVADVSSVALASMGLNVQPKWTGLATTSAFRQPRTVVVVKVDGCMLGEIATAATFRTPLSTLGADAASTMDTVAWDLMSTAEQHLVDLSFVHPSTGDASVLASVSNDIAYDSATAILTVNGIALDLNKPALAALAHELVGLLSAPFETETRQVAVFKITSLRDVMQQFGSDDVVCQAATKLVGSVLNKLSQTVEALNQGNALVLLAEIHAPTTSSATRVRREVKAVTAATFSPMDVAFVEHCGTYNCYCNKDYNGSAYDPVTRCSTSCPKGEEGKTAPPCSDCAYIPCGCDAEHVIKSSATCKACVDGYVRHGNHCYLDTNFPVATNIILIVGILLIVSLLVTCNALDMDPGRESIIYRMTSTHIKSQ